MAQVDADVLLQTAFKLQLKRQVLDKLREKHRCAVAGEQRARDLRSQQS